MCELVRAGVYLVFTNIVNSIYFYISYKILNYIDIIVLHRFYFCYLVIEIRIFSLFRMYVTRQTNTNASKFKLGNNCTDDDLFYADRKFCSTINISSLIPVFFAIMTTPRISIYFILKIKI